MPPLNTINQEPAKWGESIINQRSTVATRSTPTHQLVNVPASGKTPKYSLRTFSPHNQKNTAPVHLFFP